jgi:hypothetical protein
MSDITKRLLMIVDLCADGNDAKFAREAGIVQGTFHNYTHGRIPNVDSLINIRNRYGVNINWLLTGEGEMLYNTICSSLKPDINQNIVVDSFCESVRMLTLIYDKNRNLFETVVKYLKQAVGMLDIEEGLKDSDKNQ